VMNAIARKYRCYCKLEYNEPGMGFEGKYYVRYCADNEDGIDVVLNESGELTVCAEDSEAFYEAQEQKENTGVCLAD